MRNKEAKRSILGLTVIGISLTAAILMSRPMEEKPTSQKIEDDVQSKAFAAKPGSDHSPIPSRNLASDLYAPLNKSEKASVASLLDLITSQEEIGKSPKLMMDRLAALGLKPLVSRDSNPDTGDMFLVRTEDALPGTRYFHAQLFGEPGKETFSQHISFEIRPGPDAMATALELIKKMHKGLGAPKIQREDYVLWEAKGSRVVSAKRLGKEDLTNSYFNARSAEDIGAVWVVSEIDPEEH